MMTAVRAQVIMQLQLRVRPTEYLIVVGGSLILLSGHS